MIYGKEYISNTNKEENSLQTSEPVEPIIDYTETPIDETEKNEIKHYYYNQLDENAKIIYKALEDNIENMKTGTYKIEFDNKFNNLLNSENGSEKLNIAFQSAWNAFTYDHMEVFYIDITKLILTTRTTSIGGFEIHKVYLSNADNDSYISKEFSSASGNDLTVALEKLEQMKREVVSTLDGYSDYNKIKYLHDWMIDSIEYDTTCSRENIYNIYGALNNKMAVCEGYARAFKYMLDGLGIPCVLISGTATNSNGKTELHAWNYVKLNGKWYAIDLTWDDPVIVNGGTLSDKSRYKYFLKGTEVFLKDHKEDGQISNNSVTFMFPKIQQENYIV